MTYPKARYSRPFMMDPEHYAWVPLEQATGVSEKSLGTFTERRSSVSFLKFAPGSRHYAFGRNVFVVLAGTGRAGGEPLRQLTTLYLDRGERIDLEANEAMKLLRLGLPNLADLAQHVTRRAA
jgi:hypothetical protein